MRLSLPSCGPLLAAIGLATSLSFASLPALSAPQGPVHALQPVAAANVARARQQATDHTQALMALQKQWTNARGADKSRALEQLLAKAQARQQFLAELIKTNPAEVLRVAIPAEKQSGMPAEVLAFLEQRLELEGELEVAYEDYEDGSHKLRHFLKTPFGERFELKFVGKLPSHQSGTDVRLNGVLLDGIAEEKSTAGTMALESADSSLETLDCCESTSSASAAPELPNTLGEQKTLVILVNFQDDPNNRPWTSAEFRSTYIDWSNDFFLENSDQRTWLNSDITGWHTIAANSTACDDWDIAAKARDAAAAAGVDLSVYARFAYAFPQNTACNWSGRGTVGGAPSHLWISGATSNRTFAHEMGHNFGLGHSEGLDCGAESIGDSCTHKRYEDRLDTMGKAPGHFNGFHKERLGWISTSEINEITTDGIYDLSAFEFSGGPAPRLLKVLKGIDPQSGAKSWYYIESRKALGFDSFIQDDGMVVRDNVLNGVVIHTGTEGIDYSYLLDMTPLSSTLYDWKDPALVDGQSFIDTNAGLTMTTEWVDNNGASVSISLSPQSCVNTTPELTFTPAQGPWVAAGTSVSYSLVFTNNDSPACETTQFNLAASIPSGWNQLFDQGTVSLAPGSSAVIELTITSASSATDGYYDINVSAGSAHHSQTGTITYVVDNPTANNAPVAQDDSTSTDASVAISIFVLANDTDPDGDVLSLTTFSQGNNGSVSLNADNSLSYTPNAGFSGTDSFIYSNSDGNGGSDSATVSITVNGKSNQTPVAVEDFITTAKGQVVNIMVLNNDFDPDGDLLEVISFTQGAKGSVSLNSDGTLTYVAGKQFRDGDSFSYTVSDGIAVASAMVNIAADLSAGSNGGGKGKSNK